MKIKLLLQFEHQSANGILMQSLFEELSKIHPNTQLVYQPFKYSQSIQKHDQDLPDSLQKHNQELLVFRTSNLLIKILCGFYFVLIGFFLHLVKLRSCDHLIIQKPIGLGPLYLLAIKALPGGPKVHTIFDDWEGAGGMASFRSSGKPLKIALATWMEEFCAKQSDTLICRAKILVRRFRNLKPLDKILYQPNGSGVVPVPTANLSEKSYSLKTPFKVVHVGSYKQIELVEFLNKLAELSYQNDLPIEFQIIGGGPLTKQFNSELKNLILTGPIPHTEVTHHLQFSDLALLFLNPDWPDTLLDAARSSTKMFEYMSQGKAILAPNFGEPKEIFKDKVNAFLADTHPEAYLEALKFILENKELVHQVSLNALNDFKNHYTHSKLAKDLLGWIKVS